jgi:serine/threonine protein kinase
VAFRTRSGQVVAVGARLAAGGQGEVYAVTSPRGMVLKKYLPAALAGDPTLEHRLHAMTAHPPAQWRETQSGHVTLAWPAEIVDENGRFAGFVMPAVDMSTTVSLHRVTNPSDRHTAAGPTAWAQGFTWRYLIRTAANLAHATHLLHQAGVVIGDFNESNVRVTHEARVTLLDCDSMQISDPVTGQRFYCPVGRPEFTPPELLSANWRTTLRHPSSDLFALAIHLYQLLLEGEHPFRGLWSGPGDKPSVPELARQGIWAHQPGGPLSARPAAISINLLPAAITALFRQAFEDGAANPAARPTALQWQQALTTLENSLTTCTADPSHVFTATSPTCPWCQHAGRSASQLPLPPATAPLPLAAPGGQSINQPGVPIRQIPTSPVRSAFRSAPPPRRSLSGPTPPGSFSRPRRSAAPPPGRPGHVTRQPARQSGRRGLWAMLVAGAALLVVLGVLIATKIASIPPPPPTLISTTHVYMPTTNASSNTFSTPAYKSPCAPAKDSPHGCQMDMDIYYVKDMHWTAWSQTRAVGVGTAVTQGCIPINSNSCRITDKLISIPRVKYTFSHPMYVCGHYYWSQMIAHYPPDAPADLRAYDHRTIFSLTTLSC